MGDIPDLVANTDGALGLRIAKNVSMILGYESPEVVRYACINNYVLFVSSVRSMRGRVDYYLSKNVLQYPKICYLSELMLYYGFNNDIELDSFLIWLFGTPKKLASIWITYPRISTIWATEADLSRVFQHLQERSCYDETKETYRRLLVEMGIPK